MSVLSLYSLYQLSSPSSAAVDVQDSTHWSSSPNWCEQQWLCPHWWQLGLEGSQSLKVRWAHQEYMIPAGNYFHEIRWIDIISRTK